MIDTVQATGTPPPEPQIQIWLADHPMPYPDGANPQTVWLDILERLAAWRAKQTEKATLLVLPEGAPHQMAELIQAAWSEAERTRVFQPYHGRAERLRQSAAHHQVLVVRLEELTEWLNLAGHLNLSPHVAIAELPLHRWWSLHPDTNRKPTTSSESDTIVPADEDDGDTDDRDPVTLEQPSLDSSARWRKRASQLYRDHWKNWLAHWIPAGSPGRSLVLLDARLEVIPTASRQSTHHWDDAQRQRARQALHPLAPPQRQTPPSTLKTYESFLYRHWRYRKFKPEQRPIVEAILPYDRHVIGILPTGSGKSILFQVPALLRGSHNRRLTLVISPLRALMQDQVANLRKCQFFETVDYLSADRPWFEINDVYQRLLDGQLRLLYITPERLRSQRFQEALACRLRDDDQLEFIVFDEAHCIDQWGYGFRPDYLRAFRRSVEEYGNKSRLLFFSATLTAAGEQMIRHGLDHQRCVRVPEQFHHPIRDFIQLHPVAVEGSIRGRNPQDWDLDVRLQVIAKQLCKMQATRQRTRSAALIFTRTRRQAEVVRALLQRHQQQLRVDYFHAGCPATARQDTYQRFRDGKLDVLVATKAFGMGMDIGHIHWLIHLQPPSMLEDYLQEVGRMGRDGETRKQSGLERLDAVLIHSPEDLTQARELLQRNRLDLPLLEQVWRRLLEARLETGEGILALLPASLPDISQDDTRLQKAFYWLERAGRISEIATLPDSLPLRLHPEILQDIAEHNVLARFLLGQFSEQTAPHPPQKKSEPKETSWLSCLAKAVQRFALVLLGGTPQPEHVPSPDDRQRNSPQPQASLSCLFQIGNALQDPQIQTHFQTHDALLKELIRLQKQGALDIDRTLNFHLGDLGRQLDADARRHQHLQHLQRWAEAAIQALRLSPQPLDDILERTRPSDTVQINDPTLAEKLERVEITALRHLLRQTGVNFEQRLNDNRQLAAYGSLATNQKDGARQRIDTLLQTAETIFKHLPSPDNNGNCQVSLSKLLETSEQGLHMLEQALHLLASLQWLNTQDTLLGRAYLIALKTTDPWSSSAHDDIKRQLDALHHFDEQRIHAMELFVHLPESHQEDFIKGYFSQADGRALQDFLEQKLLEIAETRSLSDPLQQLLERIRAKQINELFDRYRAPDTPEPAQWRAISHPYDHHLLIDAGPGAGKTSVLLARIVHLLYEQKLQPENILVLAFNRAVVHELRMRVRELFTRLGYGGYVRRLRIYTFHAYALRCLGESVDDTLLERFADALEQNPAVRNAAAIGVRVVLVDEFQDMERHRYRIVTTIQQAAGASLTVVGDDDQDILGWDRDRNETGTEYFNHFQQDHAPHVEHLTVNFRSSEKIVEHTQTFIENALQSQRRKHGIQLRSKPEAPLGEILELENRANVIELACQWLAETQRSSRSLAVLCRTNAEAYDLHAQLCQQAPKLRIQGSESYRLDHLRHLAALQDLLANFDADASLTEAIPEIRDAYDKLKFPESWDNAAPQPSAARLIELLKQEKTQPEVGDLRELLASMRTGDLDRFGHQDAHAIISTIHKVKGMEFDDVLIVPSSAPFPLTGNHRPPTCEAEEEARLWYVAMTRTKSRLGYALRERERAWQARLCFTGSQTAVSSVLTGSMEEVFISWAALTRRRGDKIQHYIHHHVQVGDSVQIQEGKIVHCGQPIGLLSQKYRVFLGEAKVVAVYRYPISPDDPFWRRSHSYSYTDLTPQVRNQGWHYVVLVASHHPGTESLNPTT